MKYKILQKDRYGNWQPIPGADGGNDFFDTNEEAIDYINEEILYEVFEVKTVSDLAAFVEEREGELAPGSETLLLSAFVDDYGYMSDAMESDNKVDDADFERWVMAYARYESWNNAGKEFDLYECFD